jgi:indoleamine 2,3-dioxygenase
MTISHVPYPSPATLKRFPHVHDDPSKLSHALDPFTITTSTGFLPYATGPVDLPDAFQPLKSLVERMPVVKLDGTPGLLATYEFGPAVEAEMPDLTDEVEKLVLPDGSPDRFTLTAVFRDYTFVASSYLLEPCWENWCKNPEGGYGLGREVLPKCVARPMYLCAQMYVSFLSYMLKFSCPLMGLVRTSSSNTLSDPFIAWTFLLSCPMPLHMPSLTIPLPTTLRAYRTIPTCV